MRLYEKYENHNYFLCLVNQINLEVSNIVKFIFQTYIYIYNTS